MTICPKVERTGIDDDKTGDADGGSSRKQCVDEGQTVAVLRGGREH